MTEEEENKAEINQIKKDSVLIIKTTLFVALIMFIVSLIYSIFW